MNIPPHTEFSFGSFSIPIPVLAKAENEEPQKTKIRFVGDVMLARNVERLMSSYGYGYPFSSLPAVGGDMHLVGNFESSVPAVHAPTQSMTFSFSVDPQYIQGLKEYGFSHLGLANNHTYDFGADDFDHTIAALSEASFVVFGDQQSLATSSIAYLEISDNTVALVGVYAVYGSPDMEDFGALLAQAEEKSDFQIVYVHWGDEYTLVHNVFQEKLARQFIDAGADAVIGHHPHVVQDIELYKDAPIFYSLGNFIFDQYFSEDVQVGLAADFSSNEQSVRFELLPITSIGQRSSPRLMAEYEASVFLEDLAQKSDAELQEMIIAGVIELKK